MSDHIGATALDFINRRIDFDEVPDTEKQYVVEFTAMYHPYELDRVHSDYLTVSTYVDAVTYNTQYIFHVPPKFRVPPVYLALVKVNGLMLKHVPIRDLSRCPHNTSTLHSLVESKSTITIEDIFEAAVNNNGLAIQYISPIDRSKYLKTLAIERDYRAYTYLTRDEKTQELSNLAFDESELILPYIPDCYQTNHMYNTVACMGRLDLIPYKSRSYYYCSTSTRVRPECIAIVPKEVIDTKIAYRCLKFSMDLADSIPESVLRELGDQLLNLCRQQNFKGLEHIPPDMLTEDFCVEAVLHLGNNIGLLDMSCITRRICWAAMKYDVECYNLIPISMKTKAMEREYERRSR